MGLSTGVKLGRDIMAGDHQEPTEILLDKPLDRQEQSFEGWKISVTKYHILSSSCGRKLPDGCPADKTLCKYCEWNQRLDLPHWPDMNFADNSLTIVRDDVAINFNALDALKMVDSKEADSSIKVAASEVWLSSRGQDAEPTPKPFDWTFSTKYKGSFEGFQVEPTKERIDLESLKVHEPILFFQEIALFEDELADHGCASLDLKFRSMPSGFFILLRFYLRVDGVMVRIYDTRIHWKKGNCYLLREFVCREKRLADMEEEEKALVTDPARIWPQLPIVEEEYSKLSFQH